MAVIGALRTAKAPKAQVSDGLSGPKHILDARKVICCVALVYAALAGLKTVSDMDVFWQLAAGRWIAQHHAIPRTDVFSYTAYGREWIYPVLSQFLLYCVYLIGGFSLLSVLGALATAATTWIMLRRGSLISGFLALIAVPCIASRTVPRAEMFSVVFFALFVFLLWRFHRGESIRLVTLPIAMLFWVNLHLGFMAGLAMCAAYVLLELGDLLNSSLRDPALRRLRKATPYLLTTLVATLINPWGFRIYVALQRQQELMRLHGAWILEWLPISFGASTVQRALDWRDPRNTVIWLIAAAIIAIVVAAFQKRFAVVVILSAATYLAANALRFQALFACLVVIIGRSVISDFEPELPKLRKLAAVTCVVISVGFVAARVHDLVNDTYYLKYPYQFSEFGAGLASWEPENATRFIKEQNLPRNLYNEYSLGGYVSWALFPQYADYIDGRAVPFGGDGFARSMTLASGTLDSPEFLQESELRNINTALISLNYEIGPSISNLKSFCASSNWRPVYLGSDAAIFVRVSKENELLVGKLKLDCGTYDFLGMTPPSVSQAKVAAHYISTAWTLMALGRNQEALEATNRAGKYSSQSYGLHFARGFALQNLGRFDEAEPELLEAAKNGFDDAAILLARQYQNQQRLAAAHDLLQKAAQESYNPYLIYLELARTDLQAGNGDGALQALRESERLSPFQGGAISGANDYKAAVEECRRRALELSSATKGK